ncbi:hypothetical protein [Pseudomonas ovata]|uniref:hypothetical protein n=1 Tax=Pseudomonas ovata TaxID=1839709 RepID=UPI000D68C8D0|nr:hypothetical protein [Pseudomonas ovata]
MTGLLEHLTFFITALLAYLPAHKMKFYFSGKNFTTTTCLIATAYNLIITVIHMDFLKTNNILFYGRMEEYILGWVSMVMIGLHASALPMEWKRRPRIRRKIFDPKIRKHKLTFDRYRLAQPRKSILSFWKRS